MIFAFAYTILKIVEKLRTREWQMGQAASRSCSNVLSARTGRGT